MFQANYYILCLEPQIKLNNSWLCVCCLTFIRGDKNLANMQNKCRMKIGENFEGNWSSHMALVIKNLRVNPGHTRDVCWITHSGRFPGEGHGIPLFLSGKSRRQRRLAGYNHGVSQSQTLLKWLNMYWWRKLGKKGDWAKEW